MASFKSKLIILAISIIAVMIPMAVFADEADKEHQHSGRLLGVVVENTKPGIPHPGRFLCDECYEIYRDSITPENLGMPIIDISGMMIGMSKDVKKTVNVSYASKDLDFESQATMKWQGASSVGYPKKNYTVQFINSSGKKNKIGIVDAWGKQSKYCLKANYVDFSQSRNVVSGRIYNEIVHTGKTDDELAALPNGGVVDGFPVLIYLNGAYQGLYTFNIPKDNWMFGMKDETLRQALLFGDTWAESVFLRQPITDVNNVGSSGWELEYCSTEEDPAVGTVWAGESMNKFIEFLNNNDGEAFRAGVEQYTDVDRAIDVLLYTYFIHANDNVAKNIIWATYNGTRWIPSVYDMDGTWGMYWDGSLIVSPEDFVPSGDNLLFKRLLDNYPDKIKARYVQLRESVLSKSNLKKHFKAFFDSIPEFVYRAEKIRWEKVPSNDADQPKQIYDFIDKRTAYLDKYYGVTINDDPVKPVVKPRKPVIKKLTAGKKKLTVRMKTKPAAVKAKTYQIAYRVKGTSKWKTVSTGKQIRIIKKLKKGKRYQVRVRSRKVSGGKVLVSGWTKIKTSGKIR